MSGHIFISYRVLEADFALKLAADLKNAGVNIWMDRFELKPGDDWPRGIEQGVDNCGSMITVLSPDYVASKNCMRELRRADRMNRPLFPVLLRPVDKSRYPYELEGIQYVDFRDWRDEKVYREKVNSLIDVIRQKAGGQIGDLPDAETRYLTSLIAELEARKGVLEYVELSAQADAPEDAPARPDPYRFDEWAAGFSELIDKPDDGRTRHALSLQEHEPKQKIALKSIAEAVEKHPRFVLIGDPGAGKTTTLRKLALDAARKRLDNPRSAPIPLLLYLPQWDDEPTPLDFVRKKWNEHFQTDPAGLLQMGDILLYLDGLNEMGGTGAAKAKSLSDWLESEKASARVIVTCRAGDYTGDLKLGNTPTVLAEELNVDQISEFARNYLGKKAAAFLNRVLSNDKDEREDTRSLFHLAKNPYMLGGLALIYEYSPEGDLPRNTGRLFQKLAKALWERERQKQTPGWIPFNEAEAAFAKLAFDMIDEDRSIDVPLDYALEKIGSESLLHVGVSANYVVVNGERVRFYHQLMQEYFAASKLYQMLLSKHLQLQYSRFDVSRRIASKWDEVVIASVGIVDNLDGFLEVILFFDPYLAARCLSTEVKVSKQVQTQITLRLLEKFQSSNIAIKIAAAEALGQMRDKSIVNSLLEGLLDESKDVRISVINALSDIRDQLSIPNLIDSLYDEIPSVRIAAATALGKLGNPKAVSALQITLNDYDPWVRYAAAKALGLISDASAVEPLLPALKDEDLGVRWAVTSALRRIGTPEALAAVEAWRRSQQGGDS